MVGSGSSQRPSTLSRCGLPADRAGAAALGPRLDLAAAPRRRRGSCRTRENAVIAEWKVPPENMRAGPHDAAQGDRHVVRQLLDGEVGAEVVGDRVEAAGMHEPGAGLLGRGVVGDVHAVDELGSPVRST